MHRPLRVAVAAALTLATFAGATAATAATPTTDPKQLAHAAAEARSNASAALGGITIPGGTTGRVQAAAAASKVQSIDETIRVKVKKKRYDLHVVSVGSKADPTRITLFAGTQRLQLPVRRLVRVTVVRHGHHQPLLATTTTFRRFVVMVTGLQSNPLAFDTTHFATRSDFVAALAHGLAIDSKEVVREYGAVMRFAQMSLDLSMTLVQAVQYLGENPTATDLSAVPTVHTTAGSGGYAGTVTLSGTPTSLSVSASNTTDGSTLTEAISQSSLTITYTVGGKTWTIGTGTPAS